MSRWDYSFAYDDETAAALRVVTKHKDENYRWRKQHRRALQLIPKLKTGENRFTSGDFACLVTYLCWDQPRRGESAHKTGRLELGAILVLRKSPLANSPF